MNIDEVLRRIEASSSAKENIGELTDKVYSLLQIVNPPSRSNPLRVASREELKRAVTYAVAAHIANVARWTADRWGHADHVARPGDDPSPPSQMVIKVIKELEYISALVAAPQGTMRIRGRRSISRYAIDALLKDGVLGQWLLSQALPSDFDPDLNRQFELLGLGGIDEPNLIGEGLTYGLVNPSAFTRHGDINNRSERVNDFETAGVGI